MHVRSRTQLLICVKVLGLAVTIHLHEKISSIPKDQNVLLFEILSQQRKLPSFSISSRIEEVNFHLLEYDHVFKNTPIEEGELSYQFRRTTSQPIVML